MENTDMFDETIPENYSAKHLPYRKMKFIPDLLDKYELKFGERPERAGKEDKFRVGADVFTAGELWGRVWGQISHQKKEEKKRRMDMENLENPMEKKKVTKERSGKKGYIKEFIMGGLAKGKTIEELIEDSKSIPEFKFKNDVQRASFLKYKANEYKKNKN